MEKQKNQIICGNYDFRYCLNKSENNCLINGSITSQLTLEVQNNLETRYAKVASFELSRQFDPSYQNGEDFI